MAGAGSASADAPLALALAALDEAFDHKAWHGPNLRAATRRLDARTAAWRPAPGRHNAWELVVHAAYWKYAVRRRLTGEKRGSFPLEGSNWFPRPLPEQAGDLERAWRGDLDLLIAEHRKLRAVVAALPAGALSRLSPGRKHTLARLVFGAAFHDVYHAGQVQLLKRLAAAAPARRRAR